MSSLAALALASGVLVGCGGSSHPSPHEAGRQLSDDGGGVDDLVVGTDGGTAVWAAGHADPCTHMPHTSYLDDGLCLEPPPADMGFQLHFGPTNYDDPEEVSRFVLPPGGEEVICENFTTPNTDEKYYIEYHAHLRSGTHHMITYASEGDPTTPPDGTVGPCSMDASFHFIIGAQSALGPEGGKLDVPLAGESAPEDAGLAAKLKPHTKAIVEMHYINSTDKDMLREGWINLLYTDKDKVTGILDPIFFIGGVAMNVPPHSRQTIKAEGCGMSDGQGDQLRIVGLTGHAHAHTEQISAYINRLDGTRELIYQTNNWQEPLNAQFDSVHTYATPGVGSTDGAHTGLLTLKRGETVSWECDVNNTLDTSLHFANEAYKAEMCNLFGFVTPGLGSPWSCVKP